MREDLAPKRSEVAQAIRENKLAELFDEKNVPEDLRYKIVTDLASYDDYWEIGMEVKIPPLPEHLQERLPEHILDRIEGKGPPSISRRET